MKRRQFIKASMITGAAIGLGSALWLSDDVDHSALTIAAVLAKITELSKQSLITTGVWSLQQVLEHCAQSVEYSMTGYPEHKSEIFKQTLGALAFRAFSSKGLMTHALDEYIPGAPNLSSPLLKEQSKQQAFARLQHSLEQFKQYQGPLAPHFAYGVLSKAEYELAHSMHFYNHLKQIQQI